MSDKWHYTIKGKQAGSAFTQELKLLAATGQISKTDKVWKEGMADWRLAGEIDGLFVEPDPYAPPPLPPTSQRDTTVVYAGFWKRGLAIFIDSVIAMTASFFVGLALAFVLITNGLPDQNLIIYANQIFTIGILWLYAAIMESSPTQGTLGKMALGIKVTDLNGNPVSFGRATGRHFGRIFSLLTLFGGYLMAAFTSRKQGLHDIIAGCLVVNRQPNKQQERLTNNEDHQVPPPPSQLDADARW